MAGTGGNDVARDRPAPAARPWRADRGARLWRVSLTAVWLVYLIQPVSGLFGHHHSALYIGGGLAIIAAFCVVFVITLADWNRRTRRSLIWLGALYALALAACVFYGGSGANSLWIYVSAIAGLTIAVQRTALWVLALVGACYCVTCLTGHVDMADFLINLLPTVLLGLAMIGLRNHFELTRELTEARETVARLAASQERLRLARDMHDLTGQSLSMITLKSELALRLLGRLPAGPDRDRARDEIEQVGGGQQADPARHQGGDQRLPAADAGGGDHHRPRRPRVGRDQRRRTTRSSPCCRARSTRTPRRRWPGACARR